VRGRQSCVDPARGKYRNVIEGQSKGEMEEEERYIMETKLHTEHKVDRAN
jgi:hypothetical protein